MFKKCFSLLGYCVKLKEQYDDLLISLEVKQFLQAFLLATEEKHL